MTPPQGGDLLTREEAQALCDRILQHGPADGTAVEIRSGRSGHTRYAGNRITGSGEVRNTEVTVAVQLGQRRAAVTFNALDESSLAARLEQAAELARLAPEDPEQMPPLAPQDYPEVAAFFDETAALDPTGRAAAVAAAIEPAARTGAVAAGFVPRTAAVSAVANSAGLFAYHRATLAAHTVTVRTSGGEGSGWAGATHNDWSHMLQPAELAARALEKAERSATRETVEPGAYTVLLEPTAVGNLVQLLGSALDARAADEGRSPFARQGGGNRIGERVADELVTLWSDPRDPDVLERPFTADGLPLGRTAWIENGVLRNLAYSRYWADRNGREPVPYAGGLKMAGGNGSVADLLETVDRGLLVTRFWYVRRVDARTLTYTGVTRDGTFRIERGQLVGAVSNLRFNESILAMLGRIEAVGAPVRVVASESGGLGGAVVVPPLVVRGFHFTGVSEAV